MIGIFCASGCGCESEHTAQSLLDVHMYIQRKCMMKNALETNYFGIFFFLNNLGSV